MKLFQAFPSHFLERKLYLLLNVHDAVRKITTMSESCDVECCKLTSELTVVLHVQVMW
jgi:hypothetical protein